MPYIKSIMDQERCRILNQLCECAIAYCLFVLCYCILKHCETGTEFIKEEFWGTLLMGMALALVCVVDTNPQRVS